MESSLVASWSADLVLSQRAYVRRADGLRPALRDAVRLRYSAAVCADNAATFVLRAADVMLPATPTRLMAMTTAIPTRAGITMFLGDHENARMRSRTIMLVALKNVNVMECKTCHAAQ
jgi:hypothetical protein